VVAEHARNGLPLGDFGPDEVALGRHHRDEVDRKHPDEQGQGDVDRNLGF